MFVEQSGYAGSAKYIIDIVNIVNSVKIVVECVSPSGSSPSMCLGGGAWSTPPPGGS